MGKPVWMSDHEWAERQRHALQQFQWDVYNAPEWVKTGAQIAAGVIVLCLVAAVVVGILKFILWTIGVVA